MEQVDGVCVVGRPKTQDSPDLMTGQQDEALRGETRPRPDARSGRHGEDHGKSARSRCHGSYHDPCPDHGRCWETDALAGIGIRFCEHRRAGRELPDYPGGPDLIEQRTSPGQGTMWWDKVYFAISTPLFSIAVAVAAGGRREAVVEPASSRVGACAFVGGLLHRPGNSLLGHGHEQVVRHRGPHLVRSGPGGVRSRTVPLHRAARLCGRHPLLDCDAAGPGLSVGHPSSAIAATCLRSKDLPGRPDSTGRASRPHGIREEGETSALPLGHG